MEHKILFASLSQRLVLRTSELGRLGLYALNTQAFISFFCIHEMNLFSNMCLFIYKRSVQIYVVMTVSVCCIPTGPHMVTSKLFQIRDLRLYRIFLLTIQILGVTQVYCLWIVFRIDS